MKLNGGRHVQGILRGFDPFMNLVVDDSLEMGPGGQQNTIGMVVRTCVCVLMCVNSVCSDMCILIVCLLTVCVCCVSPR